MQVFIKDISYFLPQKTVSIIDLKEENPEWDIKRLASKTGVNKIHVAEEDETALDLAEKAVLDLCKNNPNCLDLIDGIIFCTQSADYIMPPNSCVLHGRLEMKENIFAMDINHACSGYVYGLALAKGMISSKALKNILLITADTYSKYINPRDRSAKVLFGDGAAVSWITESSGTKGIVDIMCSTYGRGFNKFIIPAGGTKIPKNENTSVPEKDKEGNVRSLENLHMEGRAILGFVNSRVPRQIKQILKENSLSVDDIDLFIFHQASKMAIQSLGRILKIDPEKNFEDISLIGNTVSSTIPIALKTALSQKKIKKNDKVLISGFGVGLSWATSILQF